MKAASLDQELESLKTILHALEPLDETQRRFVLKTVAERMGVAAASGFVPGSGQDRNTVVTPTGGGVVAVSVATGSGGVLDGQTAKQFLKLKMPKTDVQRIACLAYYLTHARNQAHFKTEDLTKLNTEAGGTPLSNPSMAVANATKQNKFLGAVGQAKKQITAFGEDVVVALPSEEAVNAVLSNHRKPRKKKSKKVLAKTK